MPSSATLIKGYLPVRLYLPPTWNDKYYDETFFYVREHQVKAGKGTPSKDNKATLFVANVPVVPGVSTKLLLKSIFGRFADVTRVTVVQNPRGDKTDKTTDALLQWTTKFEEPSFLPKSFSEGKFAHVVFANPKGMKRAYRALQEAMRDGSSEADELPGLTLERIEVQTLSDESARLHLEQRKNELGMDNSDDNGDSDDEEHLKNERLTGIQAVASRYHTTMNEVSRDRLLEECNAVMMEYEQKEEQKRLAKEAAKSQPDDDGFVTVSYSSAVGSQIDFEESATGTTPSRRRGHKRSRKKKEAVGSKQLEDFYRFQRKENKKRTLEDLRTQFEEDLKRVKRMKEERQYKPF